MVQNIAIIGGDIRIAKLAVMLANEGKSVSTYAIEKSEEIIKNQKVKICNSLEEALKNTDIVIGPLPMSKNDIELNTPLSVDKINIEELSTLLCNKVFVTGNTKVETIKLFENNNCKIVDLLKKEEFAILNTISTAEGALQIAMEQTEKTIYGSSVLILGFGKVGKTTAERFKAIHADVYCEARKEKDIAWIKTYGYKPIYLNQLEKYLDKFDIIINTIPTRILGKEQLKYIKKGCLIIDLASSPGGVDFEIAEKMGINAILALALPGKVAPITSAEFIKEILNDILKCNT